LRVDGGLEFAERALVPGAGIFDVDDGGDGGGAGSGDAAMADAGPCWVLWVVEKVT
jgi:hypothetical protein